MYGADPPSKSLAAHLPGYLLLSFHKKREHGASGTTSFSIRKTKFSGQLPQAVRGDSSSEQHYFPKSSAWNEDLSLAPEPGFPTLGIPSVNTLPTRKQWLRVCIGMRHRSSALQLTPPSISFNKTVRTLHSVSLLEWF